MKCNLVPASYRQDHRRWQRPACLALGLMLAVCAGAGLFFQYQIQREKAYYTDYLYPVQQQGMGRAVVAKMQPDRGEGIPFSLEVSRREGLAKKG